MLEHSAPNDRIFVFGNKPKIYLEARRRPASRHILSFPLTGEVFGGPIPGFDTRYRIVPGAWTTLEQDFEKHQFETFRFWPSSLNLTCLSARALHGLPLPQMPDGMYGFEVSGCLTRSALGQILGKIPDGLYELICHPGEDDADTRMRYSHWGYRWAEELEALTPPETHVVVKEQGIALTSFALTSGIASRGTSP